MTTSHQQARAIAATVAAATRAADAGVVVEVCPSRNGLAFDVWAFDRDGKVNCMTLDVGCTSEQRLQAHVAGFIQNHRAAFAA